MKTLKGFLVTAVVATIGCSAWAATFNVPADGTIQQVIDRAASGDTIVLAEGIYPGNISFGNKNVLVRSADPDDPAIVAATVIDGQGRYPAFIIGGQQTADAGIAGLTLVNGYSAEGGALKINGASTPVISRCVIRDSRALNGGAIWISNAAPAIRQCVIMNCSATLYGGAIRINYASPVIEGCQFSGNTATSGGAIYITGGPDASLTCPVIKNCIINNNLATNGGGAIYSHNPGNPSVLQCTITDNSGGSSGGGIWCWGGSNMNISGAIFCNNVATNAPEILIGGAGAASAVNMSYCNVRGLDSNIRIVGASSLSGIGNIDVDPIFMDGDWRLSEESLCIDAGNPGYEPADLETDFYGNRRVWGLAVDIGAAEFFVQEDDSDPAGARVRLWPRVINLRGQQNFLFCTITVQDCESDQIDADSIMLEGVLAPVYTKRFTEVKELVARFDMRKVAELVMNDPADQVTLTVTGSLIDGTPFTGSETLKVYHKHQPAAKANPNTNANANAKANTGNAKTK